MNLVYSLEPHLKHPQLKFALVHGIHFDDFPTHQHDFSELFIVVSGTATHTVGDYRYPLSSGDVFVINGQVAHGFSDVDELVLVNLMFESESPIFETSKLKLMPGYQALFNIEPVARRSTEYNAKLTLNQEQYLQVKQLIATIELEYEASTNGFETMLTALLQQLIITLARFYQGDQIQTNSSTMILSRALVYLEEEYHRDDLRMDQVAESAFVSVRQLERLFKQYLNISPNLYVKEKRLNLAKELLLDSSDITIQQISDQCGFSDSNYFSKCFRKETGMSPRVFRREKNSR